MLPPPPLPPPPPIVWAQSAGAEQGTTILPPGGGYEAWQWYQNQPVAPPGITDPLAPPFPPPPLLLDQHQQQPPPLPPWEQYDPRFNAPVSDRENALDSLRRQLEEATHRETATESHLHNTTKERDSLRREVQSNLRRLDVLTERLADVESEASKARNEATEHQANATALAQILNDLRDQLLAVQANCTNLTESLQLEQACIQDLKATLKKKDSDLEEFASAIELARVEGEKEKVSAEIALKFTSKKKKQSTSLLSWMFGLLLGNKSKSEADEEDLHERLQDLSRSTLLTALQTERDTVYELEAEVTTLQQHNTALSDVVDSKDSLVEELNNRVAVFEEDKIVLKAALRQLRKELREEAPKTQKLLEDLQTAQKEIERMVSEKEDIIAKHFKEVAALQSSIEEKRFRLNETDSRMNLIATYVDQLEERLATFAIARRDIELREEKCQELEANAEEMEQVQASLQSQVDSLTSDQEEMKGLFESMVQERGLLQNQRTQLQTEKDRLDGKINALKERIGNLEYDLHLAQDDARRWRKKAEDTEIALAVVSAEKAEKEAEDQNEEERKEGKDENKSDGEDEEAIFTEDEHEKEAGELATQLTDNDNNVIPSFENEGNNAETDSSLHGYGVIISDNVGDDGDGEGHDGGSPEQFGEEPQPPIEITSGEIPPVMEEQFLSKQEPYQKEVTVEQEYQHETIDNSVAEAKDESYSVEAILVEGEMEPERHGEAPEASVTDTEELSLGSTAGTPKVDQETPFNEKPFRQVRKAFSRATGLRHFFGRESKEQSSQISTRGISPPSSQPILSSKEEEQIPFQPPPPPPPPLPPPLLPNEDID